MFSYPLVSDEAFKQIQNAAVKVWDKYDDSFGYRTEKTTQVLAMANVKDNYTYIYGMFDPINQQEFMGYVEGEALAAMQAVNASYYGDFS